MMIFYKSVLYYILYIAKKDLNKEENFQSS